MSLRTLLLSCIPLTFCWLASCAPQTQETAAALSTGGVAQVTDEAAVLETDTESLVKAASAIEPQEHQERQGAEPSTASSQALSACFHGQLGTEPFTERQAASVVQVLMVTPQGRSISTGIVIRNSQSAPGFGLNAILTTRHSVEGAMGGEPGTVIGILTTLGRTLGWAEVVATASQTDMGGTSHWSAQKHGDLAVLRIRQFVPGGEGVYRYIQGVDLAPYQSQQMLVGRFSNPAGVDIGASGSGVLNEQGQLVGVMIRRQLDPENIHGDNERGLYAVAGSGARLATPEPWRARTKITGGNPLIAVRAGSPQPKKEVTLPITSDGYVEPLTNPDILASLGPAGDVVESAKLLGRHAQATQFPAKVVVAGLPSGACIIYRGTVSQVADIP